MKKLLGIVCIGTILAGCSQFGILPPGSLDRSFGSQGEVVSDLGDNEYAATLLLQPDDKIVVVGCTGCLQSERTGDYALMRYTPSGAPDASFGSDGKVLTDVGGLGYEDRAHAAVLQKDGKIVVAGDSLFSDHPGDNRWPLLYHASLARYNPDGSPDKGFGNEGKLITDTLRLGPATFGYGVAVQSDGKIVLARYAEGGGTDFLRFNPDGSPDPGFPQTLTPFSGPIQTLLVTPDDSILAADAKVLARFSARGALEPSFGDAGVARLPADFSIADVTLQPDGKIVVAGSSYANPADPTSPYASVLRLRPDGSLDSSFAGGIVTAPTLTSAAAAVAVHSDGKILIAAYGVTTNSSANLALARYLKTGEPDPAFGKKGVSGVRLEHSIGIRGMKIQSSGKIVVAGDTVTDPATGQRDFAVARFNGDYVLRK